MSSETGDLRFRDEIGQVGSRWSGRIWFGIRGVVVLEGRAACEADF